MNKPPSSKICGDVTGNGLVDMGDATLLLNHVGNPEEYPLHCRPVEAERSSSRNFYIIIGIMLAAAAIIISMKYKR